MLEWTRLPESEIVDMAIIAGWQSGFTLAIGINDYDATCTDYGICTWHLWCVNLNTGEHSGPPVEFFTKFGLKEGHSIDLF